MGRAATKILLNRIAKLRACNRKLYSQLSKAFPLISMQYPKDDTLSLIWHVYAVDPAMARVYHRQIIPNDTKILELTRELCELSA
jgi:hypothetical protein